MDQETGGTAETRNLVGQTGFSLALTYDPALLALDGTVDLLHGAGELAIVPTQVPGTVVIEAAQTTGLPDSTGTATSSPIFPSGRSRPAPRAWSSRRGGPHVWLHLRPARRPSRRSDLGFTGRVRDTSGLFYYRARFYDPEIGRFLNPDPIRFNGGISFYAYANNNPVTLTDLTGEVALNLLGAVIGGVTAYTATRLSDPDASTETLLRRTVAGAVGGALLNPLLGRAFVAAAGNMAGTLAAGGATGSSRMQRYRVAKRVRSTSI